MQITLSITLMPLLQNSNHPPQLLPIKLKQQRLLINLLIQHSLKLNNEDVVDVLEKLLVFLVFGLDLLDESTSHLGVLSEAPYDQFVALFDLLSSLLELTLELLCVGVLEGI